MLFFLFAKNEREVRQNVVQWVEKIRQTPNLDHQTEERLITVMSQLIEQKFKQFSYKELTKMLRLTPLRETTSGQELIKEERVAMLTKLIHAKFVLDAELTKDIATDLEQLDLETLETLLEQILNIPTFEQLELWISDHQPK